MLHTPERGLKNRSQITWLLPAPPPTPFRDQSTYRDLQGLLVGSFHPSALSPSSLPTASSTATPPVSWLFLRHPKFSPAPGHVRRYSLCWDALHEALSSSLFSGLLGSVLLSSGSFFITLYKVATAPYTHTHTQLMILL